MNHSAPRTVPPWTTSQVVTATLLVVSILAFFLLIYRFGNVFLIFFIAVVLSTAIRPAVNWLSLRGLPRPIGVILFYLLGFSLLAVMVIALVPLLLEQVAAISTDFPGYYGNYRSDLLLSRSRILQQIAVQLPPVIELPLPVSDSGMIRSPLQVAQQVTRSLPYLDIIARAALALTAVFVLGFSWTLESERLIRNVLMRIPKKRRKPIREFISEVEEKVGRFILGQGILCLIIGTLALLAYMLIGLPYALILAILAGILEAVPIIGPFLGAIPAVLVAFSTNPSMALWVIAASLLIQGLENYLLVPRVMKQSVGVNPLAILLSLAAFTSLLGLAGAILAIPFAAIVQLFLNRFVISGGESEFETPVGRGPLGLLRYETHELALDIRRQLREKGMFDSSSEELVEHLEASANQLERILTLAERQEAEN